MAVNKIKIPEGLNPRYCAGCGRFLGFEAIKKGYVIDYCSRCKSWTVQVGRATNMEKVYKNVKPLIEELTKEKKKVNINVEGQKSSESH